MKIYQNEIDRGVDKLITASNKTAVACDTGKKVPKESTKGEKFYKDRDMEYVKDYIPDGMCLINAILVSTNWNKNDDVFTPEDTWFARSTPLYTPANLNHQGREGTDNNIVGVIANCMPVDDDYKWLDVPKENDLPASFHILVGTYVWSSYFPTIADSIQSKIDKGEMFVSMEAYFDDFGYALRVTDESNIILMPRNDITSWISSYLRCYGGPGKVTIDGVSYKVGRWLKGITFSGMGFVENPANPGSIIFDDYIQANKKTIKFEHIKDDLISSWGKEKEVKSKELIKSSVLNIVAEKSLLWLT